MLSLSLRLQDSMRFAEGTGGGGGKTLIHLAGRLKS